MRVTPSGQTSFYVYTSFYSSYPLSSIQYSLSKNSISLSLSLWTTCHSVSKQWLKSKLKVSLTLKVSLVRVTPSGQTSFYIYTSFYSRSEAWKHGQIERERCMICKTLLLPLFPYVGHQPICAQTLPAKLVSSFPVLRLNIFSRTAFVCKAWDASSSDSFYKCAPPPLTNAGTWDRETASEESFEEKLVGPLDPFSGSNTLCRVQLLFRLFYSLSGSNATHNLPHSLWLIYFTRQFEDLTGINNITAWNIVENVFMKEGSSWSEPQIFSHFLLQSNLWRKLSLMDQQHHSLKNPCLNL